MARMIAPSPVGRLDPAQGMAHAAALARGGKRIADGAEMMRKTSRERASRRREGAHEARLGHNSRAARITVETKLFNSLTRYAANRPTREFLTLPAGATVRDVLAFWQIPEEEVFLVLRNGQDISPGLVGAPARLDVVLDHGDVIAFSGPVPYSFGYGAPVV